MKIVSIVARYLLGLMFLVFGLNSFLNFIHAGPMPAGPAGDFSKVLMSTHYFYVVGSLMVISGLLFLIGRFVPLALTLIGPVIVNILLFHLFMAPSTIGPGAVAAILWFLVFWEHRSAFAGLFRP